MQYDGGGHSNAPSNFAFLEFPSLLHVFWVCAGYLHGQGMWPWKKMHRFWAREFSLWLQYDLFDACLLDAFDLCRIAHSNAKGVIGQRPLLN